MLACILLLYGGIIQISKVYSSVTIDINKCVMFVGINDVGKLTLTPGFYDNGDLIPAKLELRNHLEALELRYGDKIINLQGKDLNNLLLPEDSKIGQSFYVSAYIRPKNITSAEMLVEALNSYGSNSGPLSSEYPAGTSFPDIDEIAELTNGEVSIIRNTHLFRESYIDSNGTYQYYDDKTIYFTNGNIKIKPAKRDIYFPPFIKMIDGANVEFAIPGENNIIKSGSLTLLGCNYYGKSSGDSPILILDGKNATATIKDGDCDYIMANEMPSAIVKNGTLNIESGRICQIDMWGGALNVSGGYFSPWDKSSSINILAPCKVSLGGGKFLHNANSIDYSVFFSSSSGMDEKDILADGHDFYSSTSVIRPDVIMEPIIQDNITINGFSIDSNYELQKTNFTGKAISFEQVKKISKESDNLFKAAQNANIGISGTDIEIDGNEYIVKSEEGLAWISFMLNNIEFLKMEKNYDNPFTNGKEYFWGTDSFQSFKYIRLSKSLDMSKYNWMPFILPYMVVFDGKGYCIKNLNISNGSETNNFKSYNMMGFLSYNNGLLANLNIEGVISTEKDKFYDKSHCLIGGLSGYNLGSIINCTYVGDINCDVLHHTNAQYIIGGLIGQNNSSLENCGMAGSIYFNIIKDEYIYFSGYGFDHLVGGLIGVNDYMVKNVTNCYYICEDN